MPEPVYRSRPIQPPVRSSAVTRAAVDEGLRAYMLSVYNYMASAVALTGLVAWGVARMATVTAPTGEIIGLTAFGAALYSSPLSFVVMLAPLAFIFLFGYKIATMRLSTAQTLFWVFAAMLGLSLSSIFLAYAGESIARVFFITAAMFAGLSLYGYTTKRDLTGFGSFLFMGLIGLVIAMIVNIFLQSSALQFAVSVIGVLIFAGLTAYDTQKIKGMYYQTSGASGELVGKTAILGAVSLYLDFINLFLFLLRLLGDRR